MDEQERQNRAVMLERVRSVWLAGVLEESLHGGEIIDLGFAYRPAALGNSGLPSWQQASEYDYLLPLGTKIEDVFAAAERVLLVLGEPGAGKTTMLLQLVTHLLAAAETDDSCPIPAVFALSAYRDDRPLSDWLVDQLANNYELPRRLAAQWIDAGRFVPLLDGLDEVDPALRPACAEAINAFRRQHPGVWLLVTARSRDYQTLATRLHMDKAIVLQPLTQSRSTPTSRGAAHA
jgi:predicted NACHT family NTPase